MMTCRKMTAKSPYSDIFDPVFNLILDVNDKLHSIIQFKIIIWPVKNGAKHANLLIHKIMHQFKLSSFLKRHMIPGFTSTVIRRLTDFRV